MDRIVEIPDVDSKNNLNECSKENDATLISFTKAIKEKKNSIPNEKKKDNNIDYKHHTENENEIEEKIISNENQVGREGPFVETQSDQVFQEKTPVGKEVVAIWQDRSYEEVQNFVKLGNNTSTETVESSDTTRSFSQKLTQLRIRKLASLSKNPCCTCEEKNEEILNSAKVAIETLKKQNMELVEALVKIQKTHLTEKKRFDEILFGVDKALSSLPVRLEKIRVRNQRNFSIINSFKFQGGDCIMNSSKNLETSDDSMTVTSQESNSYLSSRMKCLLQKMDQLNQLVNSFKKKDSSSPIELLVNSELYAISLLKKEIRSTKKRIEHKKTDTDTVTSMDENIKDTSTEDSHSKKKHSFSNELNKASNFKIFENHMILQEEAMNLLTKKIEETETALKKEIEEKEGLQKEIENLVKEIFRLKSLVAAETQKAKIPWKKEKIKEDFGDIEPRPYKLIKDLKANLEEKDKIIATWKAKYSRLQATNSNKTILYETEKKKNLEKETEIKNLKSQNKTLATQLDSFQCVNRQMKEQMDILKHQVEILANNRLNIEMQSGYKKADEIVKTAENKVKCVEAESNELKQKNHNQRKKLEEVELKFEKEKKVTQEFYATIKDFLRKISSFELTSKTLPIHDFSYDRIREILHISPSELELLYKVYSKNSTEEEAQNLFLKFKAIVKDNEDKFSASVSSWLFQLTKEKLLYNRSKEEDLSNKSCTGE